MTLESKHGTPAHRITHTQSQCTHGKWLLAPLFTKPIPLNYRHGSVAQIRTSKIPQQTHYSYNTLPYTSGGIVFFVSFAVYLENITTKLMRETANRHLLLQIIFNLFSSPNFCLREEGGVSHFGHHGASVPTLPHFLFFPFWINIVFHSKIFNLY